MLINSEAIETIKHTTGSVTLEGKLAAPTLQPLLTQALRGNDTLTTFYINNIDQEVCGALLFALRMNPSSTTLIIQDLTLEVMQYFCQHLAKTKLESITIDTKNEKIISHLLESLTKLTTLKKFGFNGTNARSVIPLLPHIPKVNHLIIQNFHETDDANLLISICKQGKYALNKLDLVGTYEEAIKTLIDKELPGVFGSSTSPTAITDEEGSSSEDKSLSASKSPESINGNEDNNNSPKAPLSENSDPEKAHEAISHKRETQPSLENGLWLRSRKFPDNTSGDNNNTFFKSLIHEIKNSIAAEKNSTTFKLGESGNDEEATKKRNSLITAFTQLSVQLNGYENLNNTVRLKIKYISALLKDIRDYKDGNLNQNKRRGDNLENLTSKKPKSKF